jgi:ketosteroid isomerase-like protein
MSENVALAREAYDAYNREGITGILVYLDPEVEWRNPVESPNAGVFVGHEGVLQWQAMVNDAFKEMHFEPDRVGELPDGRVLALVRFRFRAPTGGLQAEVPFAHVITWRDGKATAFSMYTSEAAALKAVGLVE